MPLPPTITVALALTPGQAPDWVRLVPAGEFRAADGRGPWRLADPAAVIAATALPIPVDENHASDRAMRDGGAAPARGWVVALEARADGLWGQVEWTEQGRALLTDRAYRALSPVLEFRKADGAVVRLLRAALTNTPAVPALAMLTEEPSMDLAPLRAALGLAEAADEAAILAAATAARAAQQAQQAMLTRIAEAAGLGADANAETLVTTLTARRAAGDPAQLASQIVTLTAQVAELSTQRRRDAAVAAVDAAIRAGKPIAALRDHYIARHMLDAEAVTAELTALPSINAGGIIAPPPEGASGAPTAEEVRMAAMLNIDPVAYAAEAKRLGLARGAA